jgi:hypothetical protein
MMSLLFLLLTCSIGLAWSQYYRPALYLFVANLGLSFIWFLHHATSHLPLHF